MANKLINKVAVITGAGSAVGIGKEVALAMASEGANVVVNDIGKDPDGSWSADRVVREIKQAKGNAIANYDSVATIQGGKNIIQTALDHFGHIDILVNAAGNFITKPTVEYSEKDWDAIIGVHLKGLFACSKPAIVEMIKGKKGGRIINITSGAAYLSKIAAGPAIGYCTAKAGVLGFTRMLALEMQENGITVNAISPSAVTHLFPGKTQPDGSLRQGPEYVTPIIVYLATEEAKTINGQIIYAGGGELRVYAPPMGASGTRYINKIGKWTIEELIQIMPKMVSSS